MKSYTCYIEDREGNPEAIAGNKDCCVRLSSDEIVDLLVKHGRASIAQESDDVLTICFQTDYD